MNTRQIFLIIGILFYCQTIFAQQKNPLNIVDSTKKVTVAEVSCGECQFKMIGKSCDLAVRINGKSYFVDGTTIDEHGDAHAKNGFCESVKKAEIQGEIKGDRYKATYFKIIKEN